jgi:tetratricopeptide (TPR) repeat protein
MSAVEISTLASRAAALIDLGREAEALPLLHQTLTTAPDDPRLLDLLAQVQSEMGDHAAACETALRLVAVSPHSYRGHLLASISELKRRHRTQAIAHARHAVQLAPNSPGTHAQLAQALAGRRRWRKQALFSAIRAIELAPDSASGYQAAGYVEFARGRRRHAEVWYRRALELDPTAVVAQTNLAILNRAGGRMNSAFSDIQSVLRLDPKDAMARRLLDDLVYTSINNLLWVLLALALVVAALRGG